MTENPQHPPPKHPVKPIPMEWMEEMEEMDRQDRADGRYELIVALVFIITFLAVLGTFVILAIKECPA